MVTAINKEENSMRIKFLVLLALIMTGCSSNTETDISNTESDISSNDEQKVFVSTDEEYYSSFDQLYDASKGVIEGKVISEHTEYIDDVSGNKVDKSNDEQNKETFIQLYTVYDIQVSKSYKGEISESSVVEIKILGDNENVIFDNALNLEHDKDYLLFIDFLDNYNKDRPAWLVSSTQSIYTIEKDDYKPLGKNNQIEVNKSIIESVSEK